MGVLGFVLAFAVSLLLYKLALFLEIMIAPDLLGLMCGAIGILFIAIPVMESG